MMGTEMHLHFRTELVEPLQEPSRFSPIRLIQLMSIQRLVKVRLAHQELIALTPRYRSVVLLTQLSYLPLLQFLLLSLALNL